MKLTKTKKIILGAGTILGLIAVTVIPVVINQVNKDSSKSKTTKPKQETPKPKLLNDDYTKELETGIRSLNKSLILLQKENKKLKNSKVEIFPSKKEVKIENFWKQFSKKIKIKITELEKKLKIVENDLQSSKAKEIITKNKLLKSQAKAKRIEKQLAVCQAELFDKYEEINRLKKRLGQK